MRIFGNPSFPKVQRHHIMMAGSQPLTHSSKLTDVALDAVKGRRHLGAGVTVDTVDMALAQVQIPGSPQTCQE